MPRFGFTLRFTVLNPIVTADTASWKPPSHGRSVCGSPCYALRFLPSGSALSVCRSAMPSHDPRGTLVRRDR